MSKCIAVIGMHRSGTSLVTKALETLGVQLGDNLIPAAEDNQKGFWEDKNIIDLNDRILEYAGMTWYSVSEYPFQVLESDQGRTFEKEGMDIITEKLKMYPIWGFKDPRCSRLLPFWQKLFSNLGIIEEYLFVLRNPLDIALSLKKRNDFKLNMCQHLWLVHSFCCLKLFKDKKICFVSFDDFIKSPQENLERLSNHFHLPVNEKKLSAFSEGFVSADLRHSYSSIEDLSSHPDIFPFVTRLYSLLDDIVKGRNDFQHILRIWSELEREYLKTTHGSLHEFCLHAHSRNVDVENLAALLTKYSATIAKQQFQVNQKTNEENRLKIENRRLKNDFDLITQSASWKITQPIRDVIERLKNGNAFLIKKKEKTFSGSAKAEEMDLILDKDKKEDEGKRHLLEKGKHLFDRSTLRKKMGNATSYSPDLYDLIRFHGKKGTLPGKVVNLGLKAGFKSMALIRRFRSIGHPVARSGILNASGERIPWLKPLTPLFTDKGQRILIIAEVSLPQCYKYRVKQKIEMFECLNFDVTVVSWNDYKRARLALQTHGLVIFYRVPAFPEVKMLLAECERLDIETIFDVDDLIFDIKEYAKNSNVVSLDCEKKEELLNGVKLYRFTLEHCRHAIASTSVIAKFMEKYCRGQVYVVENCIDQQMYRLEKSARLSSPLKDSGEIIIGYGSGTTTHDIDFQQCSEALVRVMTKYPHVRLAIHGHLKLPEQLERFNSRIFRVPFLKADDYFMALSDFDVNLAPLEPSLFNDAKSNIKFLEGSMFGIPTVASAGASFKQVIIHGENGFLCSTPDEWFNALDALIRNKDLRNSIGQKASETAKTLYDYRKVAETQVMPVIKNHLPPRENNKKVLVVNILFSPIAFGGATIVTEELANLVNQFSGMSVTIFSGFWDDGDTGIPFEEIVRYEVSGMNVFAIRFPKVSTQELEYRNPRIAEQFKDVLECVQPDIVHFHSIQHLGASLAGPCQALGIPYVITLHDAWWVCERQFMVMEDGKYCDQFPVDLRYCVKHCTLDSSYTYERNNYLKRILNNAAMLLTPSRFQRDFYIANGVEKAKLRINKNGVRPPRKGFRITKGENTRFCYLGGNARHKGYDWLKYIFESIDLGNYTLCITDCQKKIGLPSIKDSDWKIKGKLIVSDGFDQETIDEFFNQIDVLLFPSQWKESFGLTVREALVRDIWVIATDSGGTIEDIIPGKNGQVFARNDISGYRQAIIEAIKTPRSFDNPNKESIRLFPEQAKELCKIYNSLI